VRSGAHRPRRRLPASDQENEDGQRIIYRRDERRALIYSPGLSGGAATFHLDQAGASDAISAAAEDSSLSEMLTRCNCALMCNLGSRPGRDANANLVGGGDADRVLLRWGWAPSKPYEGCCARGKLRERPALAVRNWTHKRLSVWGVGERVCGLIGALFAVCLTFVCAMACFLCVGGTLAGKRGQRTNPHSMRIGGFPTSFISFWLPFTTFGIGRPTFINIGIYTNKSLYGDFSLSIYGVHTVAYVYYF